MAKLPRRPRIGGLYPQGRSSRKSPDRERGASRRPRPIRQALAANSAPAPCIPAAGGVGSRPLQSMRIAMPVQALGYVGVRARALEDWAAFGSGFLGMQRIDKSRSSLAFRMDDRKQRLVVDA